MVMLIYVWFFNQVVRTKITLSDKFYEKHQILDYNVYIIPINLAQVDLLLHLKLKKLFASKQNNKFGDWVELKNQNSIPPARCNVENQRCGNIWPTKTFLKNITCVLMY